MLIEGEVMARSLYLEEKDLVEGVELLYVGSSDRRLYTEGKVYNYIRRVKSYGDIRILVTDDDRDDTDPWKWMISEILEDKVFVSMSVLSEKDLFLYRVGGPEAIGLRAVK